MITKTEVLLGVSDGVNKVFTSSELIESPIELAVDGVVDGNFSFNGNSVELGIAPQQGAIVVLKYIYIEDKPSSNNSSLIDGEVLATAGDGVTKTYTSHYPIYLVNWVRVGGVVVNGYSVIGNRISLQVPPSNSDDVVISYFRKDSSFVEVLGDEYPTVGDVVGLVYNSIGEDTSSIRYPLSLVKTAIESEIVTTNLILENNERLIQFSVNSCGIISLGDELTTGYGDIPPYGRMVNVETGEFFDYKYDGEIEVLDCNIYPTAGEYVVGISLPRGSDIQSVRQPGFGELRYGNGFDSVVNNYEYIINDGFLYLPFSGKAIVTSSMSPKTNFNDMNSLVMINKDVIMVVVYGALRILYADRENDKLPLVRDEYKRQRASYVRYIRRKYGRANVARLNEGLLIN